jgi:hypothetical protein
MSELKRKIIMSISMFLFSLLITIHAIEIYHYSCIGFILCLLAAIAFIIFGVRYFKYGVGV